MLQYFIIASLLTLLSHGYLAWRLLPGSMATRLCRSLWRPLRHLLFANVLLLPGALVLTLRAPAGAAVWAVPLGHLAFADVGFCILLVSGLLLRDAIWTLFWLLGASLCPAVSNPTRRRLLLGGLNWAVVGAAGGASLVGYGLALGQPLLRRLRIPIAGAKVPPDWGGLRIVQISDLHVGPTIRRRYVEKLVATVNALEADLIVITGDLVDGFVEQLAEQVEPLRGLRARHGIFFVTGNHEYFYRPAEWHGALDALGLQVLENGHSRFEHAGAHVVLAGLSDPSGDSDADRHSVARRTQTLTGAVAGVPFGGLRILLAHRPSDVAAAAALGFDLQLSGHLHGGQFFPVTLLVGATEPYVAGLYRLGDTWLYVNRGAGYWGPPNRLGARQEVALLELYRA